jgi:hypothetical protein
MGRYSRNQIFLDVAYCLFIFLVVDSRAPLSGGVLKLIAWVVTTHDLAVTEIAKDFERRATNAHFEEHYEDGEMRFDYRMRPGVLTRTNGINVMAALGLLPGGLRTENR